MKKIRELFSGVLILTAALSGGVSACASDDSTNPGTTRGSGGSATSGSGGSSTSTSTSSSTSTASGSGGSGNGGSSSGSAGSFGSGGSAGETGGSAGSGGGSSDAGSDAAKSDAGGTEGGNTGMLTLLSSGFRVMGTKLYFLDSATHYSGDHSPPFTWSGGVTATAKSFAMSLTDMSEQLPNGKSHWVIWDIPATAAGLPADLPKVSPLTMPAELAGAKQLNLVGGKGYFGPGARGGRLYRFTIWALDVANLPGSNTSLDTIIRTTLPAHKLPGGTATLEAIGPA